jgi:hypothetical protein
MFPWTASLSIPQIVPNIADALFGIGQLLISISATIYLMDKYGPLYGGLGSKAEGAEQILA